MSEVIDYAVPVGGAVVGGMVGGPAGAMAGFGLGNAITGGFDEMLGGGEYQVDQYQSPYQPQQNQMLDLMMQRAQGNAPSPTELMMKNQMDQAAGRMRGFYASIPGLSQGMRARLAARGGEKQQSNIAQNMGELRLKEQMQAESNLADYLSNLESMQRGTYGKQQDIKSQAFEDERKRKQQILKGTGEMMGTAGMFNPSPVG